jgi:hypothetical protein
MRIHVLAAGALAGLALAGPGMAGDGPAGSWTCTYNGAPAGSISVDAASYAYSGAGATKVGSGSYTMERNILHISGGPLAQIGISLGFFTVGTTDGSDQLVFNIAPGQGLICAPGDASIL